MGQQVLIVHDQAALCRTLRILLGFMPSVETVRETSVRAPVMAQVVALRPDMVVLGVDGLPGLELVRQLRAAGFIGRIVALTTSGTPALAESLVAAGADVSLDMADVVDGCLSTLRAGMGDG